ncbi:winged helix-turn-helix domain-containing protein [Streptomyces sp. NPDC004539]|uniref:AfsR/SARP family transcriptional regulator n=1 Tax=Streptomyces sp. NPDC004539 TaxID=3154280 RepID=UPI0033B1F8BF
MLVRTLETVDLTVAGASLPLGGPKHRALLHYLALRANTVVAVDELLAALWDGPPPRTARKMVQNVVSELRSGIAAQEWYATDANSLTGGAGRIGGTGHAGGAGGTEGTGGTRTRRFPQAVLLTHGPGYVLRVDPAEVDALAFTRRAREGLVLLEAGAEPEALDLLRAALALWPHPAPAPGPAARWPERRALELLREQVVRHLAAGAGTVLLLSTETRRAAADAGAAFGHEMRLAQEIRAQIDRRQGAVCTEFGSLRVAVFPEEPSAVLPGLERARAAADAVRETLGAERRTTVTALLMPDRTIGGGRERVAPAVVDEGLAALAAMSPGTTRVHLSGAGTENVA